MITHVDSINCWVTVNEVAGALTEMAGVGSMSEFDVTKHLDSVDGGSNGGESSKIVIREIAPTDVGRSILEEEDTSNVSKKTPQSLVIIETPPPRQPSPSPSPPPPPPSSYYYTETTTSSNWYIETRDRGRRPRRRRRRHRPTEYETGRCSYCGEDNHFHEDCRHGERVECFSCGRKGHKEKFCHLY